MADATVRLPDERRDFYVYTLYRPDGRPCYVGKGNRHRWKHHFHAPTNRHLKNILAKHGRKSIGVSKIEKLTEAEAYELEKFLIREIGRHCDGGPLVNISSGGEGSGSGTVGWNKGKKMPPSHGEKIGLKLRGRKRDPEAIAKTVAALTGRKQSEEAIQKRSASRTGKKLSPEACRNISLGHLGLKPSAEALKNRSVARRKHYEAHPDARKKHGDYKKAWWSGLTKQERSALIKRLWIKRRRSAVSEKQLDLDLEV